jgi:fatty acid desaturase
MVSENAIGHEYEIQIERKLRKISWFIPLITLIAAFCLYFAQGQLMNLFSAGHYWVVLFSGMIGHAFFIVVVHDGAHKSITRTKYDRIIMNIGSGLMLLPFYAEPFRKFHLVHHANTNTEVDPLWPDVKKHLYTNHRYFYLMCTLIPLLFTLYLIISQQGNLAKKKKQVKSPPINYINIVWASAISIGIIFLVKPNFLFLIFSLLMMNVFSVLRHWCEHLGYNNEHESNTFWFPLGMGIGNHDVHHKAPHLSWLTLWIGLFKKPKTTSVYRAIRGVLFDPQFKHFVADSQSQIKVKS